MLNNVQSSPEYKAIINQLEQNLDNTIQSDEDKMTKALAEMNPDNDPQNQ